MFPTLYLTIVSTLRLYKYKSWTDLYSVLSQSTRWTDRRTELLRFQCLTLWPWTLRYVLRSALG